MIFYKVSELEGSVNYFRINSTIFHRTPTCTVFINFLFYFFILSVSFIFEYIYFYIFFHFRNYSFYTFLSNCRSSYLVSNQFIYFLIYVLHLLNRTSFIFEIKVRMYEHMQVRCISFLRKVQTKTDTCSESYL